MAASAIGRYLGFLNVEILTTGTVRMVKLRHHAKMCRSFKPFMAISLFPRWRPFAILDL